jgi:hypothetical protein
MMTIMRRSTYDEEEPMEPMKKLLGLAVAVAGMSFGVSNASANPAIGTGTGGICGCNIILRNGTVANFSGSSVEEILIRRAESGNVNAHCQVDLGSGPQVTFDTNSPLTKGFVCTIDGVPTLDWQEVIAASGQTTLVCHIKH